MSYILNEKLRNLEPYKIITEPYKIRLDANESFIDPGEKFRKEILDAVANLPLNRYPDPDCRELREAFGNLYGIDPKYVVAGNGSDEFISLIIGSFLKKDERIVLLEPDFSMYSVFANTFEKETILIQKPVDCILSPEDIIKKVNKNNAQAIIFSNPSNPLSNVINRQDIIKIIEGTDVLVVVDEAYMDFSDQTVIDLTVKYKNLIVLKTCSKAFGCAAVRLGFAISSEEIVNVLNSLRSPYNVNAITQSIGTLILSKPDYIKESIKILIQSREYLYKRLAELSQREQNIKVFKSEANYILLKADDPDKIFRELQEHSILIRKLGSMLRITVGTKIENDALISAMREIFKIDN